jgi:hypothetical protein
MKAKRSAGRKRPPASSNWVLGRRNAPFVVDGPERFRPEVLILLDVGADWVVDVEVVEPGRANAAVADWAAEKIEDGVVVRVEAEDLASAVRARAGGRFSVVVAETPEVDDAVASFEEFSDRQAAGRRTAHDWVEDVPRPEKVAFYEAAARFDRAEPWQWASDGHVVGFDAPALGWGGACAVVLGHAGESFGLSLFRSLDDYLRFARLGEKPAARRRPGTGVPLLTVHFDRPRELPSGKELVREAKDHGFVPGPSGRYPYALRSDREFVPAPCSSEDYRAVTACLEAVRRFVEKRRALFEAPPEHRVTTSYRLRMPAGEFKVSVAAPPPDVAWRWGEEDPIDGLRRREREDLVVAFRAAREAEGAAAEEVNADGWAAEEMLEFRQSLGEPLSDWSADVVSAFLLEHYPERGSEAGPALDALPRRFDRFLAWLSSSGRGPGPRLSAARARIAELRVAFLEAARDESRYGPAKLVSARMRAEGIDLSDKDAVAAFIKRFNEELARNPSLLSSVGAPHRRWVWDGKGEPPDPKGPCPCGSGRRFRKCCMPR